MSRTLEDRFWPKVNKTGACWEWVASRNESGYGLIAEGAPSKKILLAHRVSYELTVGPIGESLFIDHKCHNTSCVNPEHLRPVTHKQNMENRNGARWHARYEHRGVEKRGTRNYRGTVGHNGKTYRTESFTTKLLASEATAELRLKLFTHSDMDRMQA